MSTPARDFMMTPVHAVSCIVGVLRQYFGTEGRIAVDNSKYLWTEDPRTSDVWIMEEFHDTRDVVGKRPLILVGFPQSQYGKDVIGDMMNYMPDGAEVRNIGITQGNIRLRCISDKALSSMELATEVKYFVNIFRQQIQQSHHFDYLRPSSMVGPQRTEEYKEYWTTDVLCDIVYQENWGVFIEHLRIKSINVDMKTK